MADDPTLHDFPGEANIDAVIAEFDGDLREAIRALLHDLAVLAADYETSVSRGYVRGEIPRLGRQPGMTRSTGGG